MGQKIDPRGFRAGITKGWPTEWIAKTKSQSAKFFVEDVKIMDFVESFYPRSGVGKVVVKKTENDGEVIIFTAKPALIIGKQGAKLNEFQSKLKKKFGKEFKVNVKEIKTPELSAKVMAELAAEQLEKRMPFRRVGKGIIQRVMDKGAKGVKLYISGRLGGADIARGETFIDGRVPLQTIRADIDYYYTTAVTKYGVLGVKVWVYKGDVYKKSKSRR
ncbi:30S ribosomal protein S3 [Candidatus Absconditicoccus praedator]|uniref:30S ribosomal protein S3 n=1 Tax=Candidatus Absconditicoccus praedator TaxID=2735562 RepID=UPI001E5B9431|nr:30S ribosomal protein S3 [Candidatus Absconditicoccus praedator]UFX82783.1 30S ribosomal protein S3 [Candidatus Absconditicoccus praedator]